jgi:hypothetical protein
VFDNIPDSVESVVPGSPLWNALVTVVSWRSGAVLNDGGSLSICGHGVAMVEFKVEQETGIPRLMSITFSRG